MESLVSYAQEEYRTQLLNLPSIDIQQENLCPSAETLLSTIHYSWFLEPLKDYPKSLQKIDLNIMTNKHLMREILNTVNKHG